MTGDHFIVPLHPDYFSSMALSSLARTLPRWKAWANTAHGIDVLRTADYPFPAPQATYIGAIIQKYRPRSGKASSAFQRWIDQLTEGLKTELVPSLVKAGMLNEDIFRKKAAIEPWKPIMEVADFNSQIALSQESLMWLSSSRIWCGRSIGSCSRHRWLGVPNSTASATSSAPGPRSATRRSCCSESGSYWDMVFP
jgi:hypothetical protein